MDEQLINLAEKKYWAFLVLALLIYVPISSARLRPWVAAGLNLLFLKLYLTDLQFLAVASAAFAVFGISQLLAFERYRTAALVAIALPIFGLFLLHKFPSLEFLDPSHHTLNALATIGFSYVALRIYDLLSAVWERRSAPPSFPNTINYLLPFHMLAAGPIQGFVEFSSKPATTPAQAPVETLRAIERIALGLFKKYVLAMILKRIFLTGFSIPGWYLVVEAQVFYIWLFLDFSALSDIAVGIGALLGIATPENFNRPYFARNLIDFWERWHISLSQFIRRNIFIPIQLRLVRGTEGNYPILCASIAFTIAFVLCGLWHRGTLQFFLWGFVHAMGLVVTNIYRDQLTKRIGAKGVKKYLANPWIRMVSMIITFEFVAFSLAFISIPLKMIFP